MRIALVVPMLAVSAQLVAQTPPPPPPTRTPTMQEQPSLPVRTLPIEIVVGSFVYFAEFYYERAGLKPREYRFGRNASLTGVPWKPFFEGPTNTKTVNGRTAVTGTIQVPLDSLRGCGDQLGEVEGYLQFRTRDVQGNVHVSNVKGQKACFHIGG